jgi:hypothetical protein
MKNEIKKAERIISPYDINPILVEIETNENFISIDPNDTF